MQQQQKLEITTVMERMCTLHPKQKLDHYCDTCRDAVCQLCIQLGPHADIRHKIMAIDEAAKIRQMFYLAYRQKQIRPTIDKVFLHLGILGQKEQMVSKQRKVIEKDISIQFEGIISRIESLVSKRIIKKQTEIKNYQEILNRIEDLVYSFDGVVQFPQRFLLCYKQFHQQLKLLETMTLGIHCPIEQVLTLKTLDMKAISTSWKIQPIESQQLQIPRQMAFSFARANQLPLYIEKNNFMNSLVGKAVEHYHKQLENAQKQVIQNQKKILSLYNHQNLELIRMHRAMVCAFCLAPFNLLQANESCSYNKSFKSQPNYKDIQIPPEVKGSKMHYWVKARSSQRPIPDLNTHSLVRIVHKKLFMNSLKDIKEVQYKLRQYDIDKGKQGSYLQQFRKNDPEDSGKVSTLAFLFIMTNKFQVDQTQVKVLSNLCTPKGEEKSVDYSKMTEILKDPLSLHRAFQEEEQEAERSKPTAPPSFKYRY